jgi:hypothetical protein
MVSAETVAVENAVTESTTEANKQLRNDFTTYPSIAAEAPTASNIRSIHLTASYRIRTHKRMACRQIDRRHVPGRFRTEMYKGARSPAMA